MTGIGYRRGTRDARPDGMDLNNWDSPPYNRWSFRHMREIVPTALIPASSRPAILYRSARRIALDHLVLDDGHGATTTARSMLDHSFTDGFLILHGGKIVCEEYLNGMRPQTLHITHSVTKSVVGSLAGILHALGEFPLDRTVSQIVPEFSGSAYRDATITQLLDMSSGVHFPEDSADPATGFGLIDIAIGWKSVPDGNASARTLRELIGSLRQTVRLHGANFEYRSIETEVLGICIEAAVGVRLADLVSDLIWEPIGAEHEANFGLDRQGNAVADGGLSASLRDLGRFGLIYAQDGSFNGRQIVPEHWVRATRIGDASMFLPAAKVDRPNGGYRNQFWIEDVDKTAILAAGVFGQMIYIDHRRDFVGVKLSSWPDALNPGRRIATQKLMNAIADELLGRG